MTKEVVLVSGGINSTVMLYRELITKGHDVHPLAINYGQKNIGKERNALLKNWENLNSTVDPKTGERLHPIKFLDVSIMRYLFKSGLTWPDIEIVDDVLPVIPFRDSFVISTAVACADLVDAQRIVIGTNDINPDFKTSLQQVVIMGSNNNVKLDIPFAGMLKEEILKMGLLLQVPFETTYGCYRNKAYPCGKCLSCAERRKAFKAADIEDKTIYIDDPRANKKSCCG